MEHQVKRVPQVDVTGEQVESVQLWCGNRLLGALYLRGEPDIGEIQQFMRSTMCEHEVGVLTGMLREAADFLRADEADDPSDLLARIDDVLL